MQPFICFQITSYNKSKYLMNAVESILCYCPFPYEILISEGHGDPINQKEFTSHLSFIGNPRQVQYYPTGWGLGFARTYNWLSETKMSPEATIIIQLSEDMFFAPTTIRDLIEVALKPEIGIATCNAQSGMFDRLNPKSSDVDNFAKAYSQSPQPATYGEAGSFPFCMRRDVWELLKVTDVWDDRTLPKNKFKGAFDEGIDPSPYGWHQDWDIIARLGGLSLKRACLEHAFIYHYDHVSCENADKAHPGWTEWARRNYFTKYPNAPADRSSTDCFQKLPWNPLFAPKCHEPWAVWQNA